MAPATSTSHGPTDRQQAFARTLQQERGLPTVGLRTDISKREASAAIDALMRIPRTDGGQSPRRERQGERPRVPDGRYALDRTERLADISGDDAVLFFRVNTPEEGRWQGFTFVDRLVGENREKVRGRLAMAVLRAIAADPQAALYRYGRETGTCGQCGRNLTDDDSRALGIGPDCFERLHGRTRRKADIPSPDDTDIRTFPAEDTYEGAAGLARMADRGDRTARAIVGKSRQTTERDLASRMAARIPVALAEGVSPLRIEEGIREDDRLSEPQKRRLLAIVGQNVEQRMAEMEVEGDREQTAIEESRRWLVRAAMESTLGEQWGERFIANIERSLADDTTPLWRVVDGLRDIDDDTTPQEVIDAGIAYAEALDGVRQNRLRRQFGF